MNINLSDIIEFLRQKEIDCSVEGETEGSIAGFASIKEYRPGCITWLKSEQISYDPAQNIALCVVKKGVPVQAKTKIITEEPKRVFFEILENFFGKKEKAVICDDSIVGNGKDRQKCFHRTSLFYRIRCHHRRQCDNTKSCAD